MAYSHIGEPKAAGYHGEVEISLKIRQLRKAKGLTIAQLADKIGVTTSHLSQVERGKKNVNNHLLAWISRELDVPPNELIGSAAEAEPLTDLLQTLRQLGPEDQMRVETFALALLASSRRDSKP